MITCSPFIGLDTLLLKGRSPPGLLGLVEVTQVKFQLSRGAGLVTVLAGLLGSGLRGLLTDCRAVNRPTSGLVRRDDDDEMCLLRGRHISPSASSS